MPPKIRLEPAYILLFSCEDRTGIVAAISGLIADFDGFILDSQQYADLETGQFFMRVEFADGGDRFPELETMRTALRPIAEQFGLVWSLTEAADKPKAVVAVSKGMRCLADLLHRQREGALGMRISAVVGNHEAARELCAWHQVPFHYLPVDDSNRAEQEAAIRQIMTEGEATYLILARYMQVLSADMTQQLNGRCINIHHSFLPGFKGARPYHRAHERGVKLIGATAHFVTEDLDEGPIIEQAVERVDHRASADDLVRIGRDIEAQVLARAVDWTGRRRVLLNGRRTVVFR
ncbi:formyltetrahydrofolate deformylase [Pacificimonas flava]|uniref:Formyltetrahydrofolate deformylase n=2 Tax=Pacificimonas TaxID=1960290 RepID=A0A219B6Q5_9SPHN|nr:MULTISPECIES: formyltetrahydrofolate deformylase [Pacificimonas]MBZ6378685.1 formyltetrahydrofolate deformylase [Pacificimonas aurantium]OWV34045.1 formyltetrahydrofolate deformylase [Pacificimonas flava]